MAWAAVPMLASGRAGEAGPPLASMSAGSIRGSSPCTLTTTASPSNPALRAGFCQPVAAAGVVGAREQGLHAVGLAGLQNARVVGETPPPRGPWRFVRRGGPHAPPWALRRCRPGACPADRLDAMRAGISTVKPVAVAGLTKQLLYFSDNQMEIEQSKAKPAFQRIKIQSHSRHKEFENTSN